MKRKAPPFLTVVGGIAAADDAAQRIASKYESLTLDGKMQITAMVDEALRERRIAGQTREQREAASPVIKAAVRYVSAMAAMHEGFKVDHTSESVVAGFGNGAAEHQLRVARRALGKLILSCRLSQDTSPVEMAAKASVAKFIMAHWRSGNWQVQDPQEHEGCFLDAFADQTEEVFKELYCAELNQ